MDGYFYSRGALLSRGSAKHLTVAILSALALAACGGGGGGGGSSPPPAGSNPPPPAATTNSPPTADAGQDKASDFPQPVSFTGAATDPENGALTYTWSATGPGTATFANASALTTTATFSVPGTYTVTLAVSDGSTTVTDTATVNAALAYPAPTWKTATAAEVGLNEAKLNEARDVSTQANPEGVSGGSGVVIRYGKLVYSWGDPNTRYDIKSTTKSIGGLALFLGLAENRVTQQTVAQSLLGSEFAANPTSNITNHSDWVSTITVQQLATHTAGFEKEDDSLTQETTAGARNDGELLTAPAATWRYSDAGLNWLADVLTKAYQQDLYGVVKSRVFDPLGITSAASAGQGAILWRDNQSRPAIIDVNGIGVPRRSLAAGMLSSVDAMARIGYLMLRNGAWNGSQVLPENIVALARQPQVDAAIDAADGTNFPAADSNYGLLWWTNAAGTIAGLPTDAYWAWGLGESLIIVIPSLDLVIARAGPQPTHSGLSPRSWNYGWNGDYSVLAPFLRPLAEAASTP